MNSNAGWASPAPAVLILFGCLAFMVSSMLVGFVSPAGGLLFALASIGTGAAYLVAATIILRSGDVIGGNTFLYFSSVFTFMAGFTGLGVYFSNVWGWPIDMRILGWMWLFIGGVLTLTTPAFKNWPILIFILIILADVAFLLLGFAYVNVIGPVFFKVAGVLLYAVALIAGYMGGTGILAAAKPVPKEAAGPQAAR